MKIVGQQSNPLAETGTSREAGAAGGVKPRGGQTEAAAPAEDTVRLSPLARTLGALRTEVGDVEAIDEKRVAELRESVQNGTYNPSSQDIAGALIRELASNKIV
jgi:negative regulator of flagellin synthesis FlgM